MAKKNDEALSRPITVDEHMELGKKNEQKKLNAVNEALKFLKASKRQELLLAETRLMEEPFEEVPPLNDIPPDVIQQMVKSLPTGYRTVFNLYVFENKSHSEIAHLLGIKESSSSSQFSRAKSQLAKMIRQYNDKEQLSR